MIPIEELYPYRNNPIQELYPYRNYTHRGAISTQELYPHRNYNHTGTISIQELYACRNYTHTGTVSIQEPCHTGRELCVISQWCLFVSLVLLCLKMFIFTFGRNDCLIINNKACYRKFLKVIVFKLYFNIS